MFGIGKRVTKSNPPKEPKVLYEVDWDKVESLEDIKGLLKYLLWFVEDRTFTEEFIELYNIPKKILREV